jgi:hypothetical protein
LLRRVDQRADNAQQVFWGVALADKAGDAGALGCMSLLGIGAKGDHLTAGRIAAQTPQVERLAKAWHVPIDQQHVCPSAYDLLNQAFGRRTVSDD